MPLYIKDSDINELAKRLQKATKAPTMSEAVRRAIKHELERVTRTISLGERVAKYQDAVREAGYRSDPIDDKRFADELAGGL